MAEKTINKEDILKTIEEKGLERVRFLYNDLDGITRGYCSYKDSLSNDLDSGLAFAKAMPVFSALDTIAPGSDYDAIGELRCVPDLSSFRVIPYAEKEGLILCDFKTKDHEDWELCGRTLLSKVLEKSPYKVSACFENEFYFVLKKEDGTYVPFDNSLCFSSYGMQPTEKIVREIVQALKAQGMNVEKYYPEYGPGQQELVIKYDHGLQAADNQILYRETVRSVAAKHGVIASFMPKPFQGLAGSGCHLHISMSNGKENLFYSEKSQHNISDLGLHFIGGVLEHIGPLCALTASTVTSYKRLTPHNWASAYSCYGLDNREAALRICSGQKNREAETTHIEFKPIDGACNPYLALAAVLAAGLDGIARKVDPGEAVAIDPDNLSSEEKDARKIKRLPTSLQEANSALKNDAFFARELGQHLVDEYIILKEYQWDQYHAQITPWEVNSYLEIY